MMYNNVFNGYDFLGMGLFTLFGFGLLMTIIVIGVAVIKGYALWTAARRNEPWWFVILIFVNTIGILDLIYLYFVAGKFKSKENRHNQGEHLVNKSHDNHNG